MHVCVCVYVSLYLRKHTNGSKLDVARCGETFNSCCATHTATDINTLVGHKAHIKYRVQYSMYVCMNISIWSMGSQSQSEIYALTFVYLSSASSAVKVFQLNFH